MKALKAKIIIKSVINAEHHENTWKIMKMMKNHDHEALKAKIIEEKKDHQRWKLWKIMKIMKNILVYLESPRRRHENPESLRLWSHVSKNPGS